MVNSNVPEIISNSLKHGLNNNEKDLIYLKINKNDFGNYELVIGDNGKGYTKPENIENLKSLGLMLIEELTHQLNGQLIKTNVKKRCRVQNYI